MTGYALRSGAHEGWSWSWEIRGVNGRGLDVRLRLPDMIEGLDQPVRQAVQRAAARGNITVSLRLARASGGASVRLDPEALDRAVRMIRTVEDAAAEGELTLVHATAADILGLRGVLDSDGDTTATGELRAAVLADLDTVVAEFTAARAGEGAALAVLLGGQIDRIEALTSQARACLPDRDVAAGDALRASLARLLDAREGMDETRIAQELALLAVKADITEELDRLTTHATAARSLLADPGPKGRKLDFLTQELNREANTLCSKAGYAPLTAIGLDLKTVIDQMREQVQNVE